MQQELDILSRVPAALATHQAENLSPAYTFLPTTSVIQALEEADWIAVEARQAYSRKEQRFSPFAKHQIIFTHTDFIKRNNFEEFPRLVLTNAHDGTSTYKLQAGLYRVVCANGMIISDGVIQSVSIRHSHRTIEEVVSAADAFRFNADRIAAHVERFREIELTEAEQAQFALQAIHLRGLGSDSRHVVEASGVLALRRSADAGNSLWRVFNRVQEHLLKGGFPVWRMVDGEWHQRQARKINAIAQSTELNTSLWDLAEQFSLN
jgi:uncharacterized protein DUF932